MPSHRVTHYTIMAEVRSSGRKDRSGQTQTWHKWIKLLTVGLSHVGRCILTGWGPWDKKNYWLKALGDENRCQWRRCIHTLSSHLPLYLILSSHSFVLTLTTSFDRFFILHLPFYCLVT
ncbi:unnamed protein product [Heterobilharzia americana]|nr:unnamed protein product [Heterobilharzia americana]